VIGDTAACPSDEAACTVRDAGAREAIQREVGLLAGRPDGRVDKDVEIEGKAWKLMADSMPPILGQHYAVGAAVPVADISAASRTLTERSLVAGILVVLVAIAAGFGISRLLSRSIARIAVKTERIRNLDFSDRQPVTSRIREILQLSNAVERMRDGLEIFGRYVSKDLVRQIMRSPENAGVGGVRRELTVMFTDIEGFSRLSEGMPPELLTSRLSRYFEELAAPIVVNHGTIDKFIGDSIMAFWNAPEPDPDHVFHACRAALDAAAAGRRLAEKWHDRDRPGFRTRFGLHTGPAVVGNVGARDRINYTLVGAVANQASRLEGLNKMYGTEILASGEVAQLTAERLVWRHIDRVVPAGTTEALDIYEPLEGSESSVRDLKEFLARWNAARKEYDDGRFAQAIAGFRESARLRPGDGPCQTMIERCERLAQSGLPDGWDGAWHFERK
jgi:adenylate cyclase